MAATGRDRSVGQVWYRVVLLVGSEEFACFYRGEHVFVAHPDDDTLVQLLEEAKVTFSRLYPEEEAVDYSVEVRVRE